MKVKQIPGKGRRPLSEAPPKARRAAKRKPHQRQPRDERMRTILMAALDLYSTRDFNRVTVRDIAAACDIDIALIYYYFANKDDLFGASIKFAIQQALSRYRSNHLAGEDPISALNRWFDINIELAEPLKKMAKALIDYKFREMSISAIDRLIRQIYKDEYSLLSECINEGVRRGLFRPVDPHGTAIFVSTHLDGIFFATLTRPEIDMRSLMLNLQTTLWDYLGCGPRADAKRPLARLADSTSSSHPAAADERCSAAPTPRRPS
jgi:TetR/AcrR family transcriptional regulator, cholesterol catabolism regulator